MVKQAVLIFIAAILLAGGVLHANTPLVRAQDPTIPTRTPTPDPNAPPPQPPSQPPSPTATSQGTGNNNPPPANTPVPTTAADQPPTGGSSDNLATVAAPQTNPVVATAVTPLMIQIDPCADTPVVQALSRITVHGGPGLDYPIIATIEMDDVRFLLGRAGFATWWFIQVTPNLVGWVLDDEVNEFGDLALLPIVESPLINGVAPTPGPLWEPTPIPFTPCAENGLDTEPNESASETDTSSVATQTGDNSPEPATTDTLAMPAPEEGVPTATAVAAITLLDQQSGTGVQERGSLSSAGEAQASSNINLLLPLAGIGLIGAGIGLALLTRGRSATPPTKGDE